MFVCGKERERDFRNREKETKLPMVCTKRQLLIFSLSSRGFSNRHKISIQYQYWYITLNCFHLFGLPKYFCKSNLDGMVFERGRETDRESLPWSNQDGVVIERDRERKRVRESPLFLTLMVWFLRLLSLV